MARSSLTDLEAKDEFVGRHIGPSEADIGDMLDVLGYGSLDELVDTAVPDSIRQSESLTAPPCTEGEVVEELRDLSEENDVRRSMIGLGYHDTVTPPVILRNVLENPGWYTAYTPYQAEISQGRLEALLNFQQMVIDLTGMPLANASMLDEATAAAEAVTMMHRVGKSKAETVFVARDCHPQTIAVIETRAKPLGLGVVVGDPFTELEPDEVFGAVLQVPATDGTVHDYRELVERLHAVDALVTVACDLLGCALLTPPGEWGADVVVGSAQRFGVPLGFGGPHAAFLATHETYKRSVPGRLIGVSKDAQGRPALRMALQTREQHIRREKATSNICTAQVLLANIAGLYAVWHGPGGLRRIAERVHRLAAIFAHGLKEKGVDLTNGEFFDTVTVDLGDKQAAEAVHVRAFEHGINLRPHDDGRIGVAFDETTDRSDVEDLWRVFTGEDDPGLDVAAIDDAIDDALPKAFRRTTPFLEHPVFNSHHSETGMMRYLRGLEEKDLALNRAMIPLGSCTMKLNAAAEMIPITLEGFARLHPFAPLDQATGYRKLIDRLEEMLTEITGFAAVSFQPNAGSQGEYAGLLAIRRYHEEAGDDDRDVCLIPSSAHGTNPASAILAGMRVVVVGCDKQGNVDVDDLAKKADEHRDRLGALMVTYPSTHGVFEREIRKICDIVHDAGGLVYMDGANLQAMVGLCRPGEFGPDVMHMNLHKTFCIPHGGGGPGVGPIGVVERLKPYLPNHPLTPAAGPETGPGAVAAAPWGSASILPISYAYIRLMGGAGLTKATKVAILNANYVATRLASHYKILYSGAKGLVAHECIIDTRPIQEAAGITVGDIAKRLMDYGFHGPTMSWPVMHTLMMEPTESEPKEELDRFCEAMIAIHDEAHRVESGDWPADDNPLVNAPHTADVALADDWPHPYSRETAVYPVPGLKAAKYWPAVGRIDDAYGDRHLVCTCPPLEDYRQEAAD